MKEWNGWWLNFYISLILVWQSFGIYKPNSMIILKPVSYGLDAIKLFALVIYENSKLARAFLRYQKSLLQDFEGSITYHFMFFPYPLFLFHLYFWW